MTVPVIFTVEREGTRERLGTFSGHELRFVTTPRLGDYVTLPSHHPLQKFIWCEGSVAGVVSSVFHHASHDDDPTVDVFITVTQKLSTTADAWFDSVTTDPALEFMPAYVDPHL